jgi:hypothetical protein
MIIKQCNIGFIVTSSFPLVPPKFLTLIETSEMNFRKIVSSMSADHRRPVRLPNSKVDP